MTIIKSNTQKISGKKIISGMQQKLMGDDIDQEITREKELILNQICAKCLEMSDQFVLSVSFTKEQIDRRDSMPWIDDDYPNDIEITLSGVVNF